VWRVLLKRLYLKEHKLYIVQDVERWIVCTNLIINVFVTLATQQHLEYHRKALFETSCITMGSRGLTYRLWALPRFQNCLFRLSAGVPDVMTEVGLCFPQPLRTNTDKNCAGEPSMKCKVQTRPLVRNGAQFQQIRKCVTVLKIRSWAPNEGLRKR
jgi:hypothetical protein